MRTANHMNNRKSAICKGNYVSFVLKKALEETKELLNQETKELLKTIVGNMMPDCDELCELEMWRRAISV